MRPSLFHVDAFTDLPFAGNAAAVCLLSSWREDQWLQAVARELNLSQTDFLIKKADGCDQGGFSPNLEEDVCGQATLASAHLLWQHGHLKPGEQIRFSTRSGILKAVRPDSVIEFDLPWKPEEEIESSPALVAALGVLPRYVGKNQIDYLVEVASEVASRSVAPAFNRLVILQVRGIIVTSRSADPAFDFVSQFFAPALGEEENPVTGSAHCCLGDFCTTRQVCRKQGISRLDAGYSGRLLGS